MKNRNNNLENSFRKKETKNRKKFRKNQSDHPPATETLRLKVFFINIFVFFLNVVSLF
jgi:hypothetical protein